MTGMEAVMKLIATEGLPQSIHTEKAVLGAMQSDADCLLEALELLEPRHFALDSHRRVFTACRNLADAGTPVNVVTLMTEMDRTGDTERIGGTSVLFELLQHGMRLASLKPYAQVLREKSAMRETLNLLESIAVQVVDSGAQAEQVLSNLTARAYEIEQGATRAMYKPLSSDVFGVAEEMVKQRDRPDGLLGITTGLGDLDEITTGYRNGELTYVGAPPGSGKTSFMLQGAFAAARAGYATGIISLEMRTNQLIRRLTILAAKLDAWKMRDAKRMNVTDFNFALQEMESLGDLPIFCCDQDGLNPNEITAMARRMVRNDGVRILFVDFIQIVSGNERETKKRIDAASAALRSVAKNLNIPVVVASQLSRPEQAQKVNRIPTLFDLRESGNLEQDAHNVILLFRPVDVETRKHTGLDQIFIAKCREGAVGDVKVRYDTSTLQYVAREVKR